MMRFLFAIVGGMALIGQAASWDMGEPIVTYWAGPGFFNHPEKLTERAARQLKEGGFNLVWTSSVEEMDVAQKYGLRAMYDLRLGNYGFHDPEKNAEIEETIARVKNHPALFLYHHQDEPSADAFEVLGKARRWLARHDPIHPTWVNLLPTYASNKQLGVSGEIIGAYWQHVRLFCETYCPAFLSYDHYQFNVGGDTGDYLLNLDIVRRTSAAYGIPFMNGVQACTWRPGSLASPSAPRIPESDELRYLVYTTLAYGAQGIYYYVYSYPGHAGSIVELDGTPTPRYEALKTLNREFVAIARELKGLPFGGAYMLGQQTGGVTPYCAAAGLKVEPRTPSIELQKDARFEDSVLVTRFGPTPGRQLFMVVNLDYRKDRQVTVEALFPLARFDATAGKWLSADGKRLALHLPRGGGVLLRETGGLNH